MRNGGESPEIENSAQFVLKGPSQLLLQPPGSAHTDRHMGSLCKMTTVVVVLAALVESVGFPAFSRREGGRDSNVMPLENLLNLGKSLRLGWVVAMLQSLKGGITCTASARARQRG